jgi:hypothetical protein
VCGWGGGDVWVGGLCVWCGVCGCVCDCDCVFVCVRARVFVRVLVLYSLVESACRQDASASTTANATRSVCVQLI